MTLTQPDLQDLTGYKRNADVIGWLKRYGIPHAIKRDGTPSLTQHMFEQAMLQKRSTPEPDWSNIA